MRVAAPIILNTEDRSILEGWAQESSSGFRLAARANIILLAAAGKRDLQIAEELGITNQKAARWRKRFLVAGLPGLEKYAPRTGRKPKITAVIVQQVITKTTHTRPDSADHWSARKMAREIGISEASVRRIWRANGLKPHLLDSQRTDRANGEVESA